MIRGVICDFGGVLTTSMTDSFQGFADEAGIDLGQLGEAIAVVTERDGAHPLFELECGRITEPEFMQRVGDALSQISGREVSMRDFSERLWEGLAVNEPMVSLMTDLQQAGYRMALLTNNVREWGRFWRAMVPVDDIFELVIDSAYVGMRKPDPAIYEMTVEELGVPAAECLFIDDFEINCEGARALGMTAVQFQSTEQAVGEVRELLDGGPPPAGGSGR